MGVRRTGGLMAVAAMLAVLMPPVSASADASPAAAVISPTDGGQVAGFVSVSLAGTVTAGSDTAQRLQLYVDHVYKAEQSCVDAVACMAAITWDTTTLVGQHTLQARLVTSSTSVMSAPVTVQVGDAPNASITSPADGASVRGKVPVTVAGTVDELQPDAVQSLQLLVDGAAVTSASCAAGVKICLASLVWNSTGTQGNHQLRVGLTSVTGQSALSPVVNVQANNPAPTAVLTSPTALSTVQGKVHVVTVGNVDPTQVDLGSSVQLLVDASPVATVPCAAMSCPATFTWNTSGKAGTHTLQALFTTASGRTAMSPVTAVWVLSTSTVTLDRLPVAASGASVTAGGKVTSADGAGVAGVKVVVSVRSTLGKGNRTATVVTDSRGRFALPYTVVSDTTVTASVAASAHYSAGSATRTAVAVPVTRCRIGPRVARDAPLGITCQLGSTTRGTVITLQQLKGASWQAVASGKTSGPDWTWTANFHTKGAVQLRICLAASTDFAAVTGKVAQVVVS